MRILSITSAILLSFSMISPAANIILVTQNPTLDAAFISFLEDGGKNTVTVGEFSEIDSNSEDRATLNAANLVVVSRNTLSDDYSDSGIETAAWSSITTPIWLGNAYMAAQERWYWGNHLRASVAEDFDQDITPATATIASHPIFDGVPGAIDPAGFTGQARYNISTTIDIISGNSQFLNSGTIIATRNNASNQWVAIGEFEKGALTGNAEKLAAPRLFFALPEDFGNATAEGQALYHNALNYMLAIPEPSSHLFVLLSSLLLATSRRR